MTYLLPILYAIANIRQAWLDKFAVGAIRKYTEMKVSTLVARNVTEAMESAFGRSLVSGVRFFVGEFGRNKFSVALKMFHV
jgi:hypothetical protein